MLLGIISMSGCFHDLVMILSCVPCPEWFVLLQIITKQGRFAWALCHRYSTTTLLDMLLLQWKTITTMKRRQKKKTSVTNYMSVMGVNCILNTPHQDLVRTMKTLTLNMLLDSENPYIFHSYACIMQVILNLSLLHSLGVLVFLCNSSCFLLI